MANGDLKSDLINGAYSQMRISGITLQPSSEDNKLALRRLEGLMNELFKRSICVGYNFEDNPDINTPSGVGFEYWFSIECILAFRLLSDFGKGQTPDQILVQNSFAQVSFLHSSTANPRQTQYPDRQSVGSGNTLRGRRWQRFYRSAPEAPNTCETNQMVVGDIDDFVEHFDSYLIDPEDIDTYTIEADTGLTIVSDSNATPDINYRVSAVGNNENSSDPLLQVKIIITTTTGRVETRLIDFSLTNVAGTP